MIMARRKLKDKLINKNDITEQLSLINGSNTDYITPSGKIYKDYGNDNFFLKKNVINKYNGYIYCNITFSDGKNRQRRVHNLLAKTYISNPNNYPIVMHLDNNKLNINLDNLKWGTISENTQQAINDKLMVNDKSWEDSQSIPCTCYDTLTNNLIGHYGSYKEASRELNISATTISNQVNNILPIRKDKYFVEYNKPPRNHSIIIEYDFNTDKEICRYINKNQAEKETNKRITYIDRKPYKKLSETYFLKVLI